MSNKSSNQKSRKQDTNKVVEGVNKKTKKGKENYSLSDDQFRAKNSIVSYKKKIVLKEGGKKDTYERVGGVKGIKCKIGVKKTIV